MAKYIPLDSVLAEIENIIADENESIKSFEHGKNVSEVQRSNARIGVLTHLRSLLDTLEVKEGDLEKELTEWHKKHFSKKDTFNGKSGFYLTNSSQLDIAKHFFELGLNASNPLTWDDMMLIHKCCKDAMNSNLYAWQTAEGQQKIYEDVLKRFKAQKGE